MGKNLVVRLHVYLMCFLLAFSTPYAYASAAPKLDFVGIANFVRDAGGATADYIFKRAANDPNYNAANDDYFDAKNHRVSNSALGKVGRSRILNPYIFVAGVAVNFAVTELISKLELDGWTVDMQAREIYKLQSDGEIVYCTSIKSQTCFSSVQEVWLYDARFKFPENQTLITGGNTYTINRTHSYKTHFGSNALQSLRERIRLNPDVFSSANFIAEGDINVSSSNQYGSTSNASFIHNVDIYAIYDPDQQKVHATDEDVAAVLPNVSAQQIEELLKSPDFTAEPHSPTIAAAAKAEPRNSANPCPAGQTKKDGVCKDEDNLGNKCPAGQVYDAETKQCKSNTPPKCPAGQVYDPVQKKCVSPKIPDDDDDEDDWPEFCEWAAPVCDFIEWARQDVDKFDVENVEVEDTANDAQSITSKILTLGYVSGGVKSCPADEDLSFEFMGQSIGFDLSYQPLCDMLSTARPVVIAIAYFQAAKIVFVGRRD